MASLAIQPAQCQVRYNSRDVYGDVVAIGTAADGNSDREISGLDFLVWQQNVGIGPPAGNSLPVPELASALLITMLIISLRQFAQCD